MNTKTSLWTFLLLVALAILGALLSGQDYHLHLATKFLIYGVLAIGLNILVGYTGLISLGHAGLFAIGAYASAIFMTQFGMGLVLAIIVAGIITAAFGVVLAYPTVRVQGVYLAVITIAFGLIVENVAIEWSSLTGGTLGISNIPKPEIFGWSLNAMQFYFFAAIIFCAVVLFSAHLRQSRFGRMMIAVSQTETAAKSLGVNIVYIRVLSFALSAGLAGVAGALFSSFNSYISPDIFTFNESIRFLLMVVVGGAGSIVGVIIGTGVLTFLPDWLQQFAYWQQFAYGALLLIVMVALPGGFVGLLKHRHKGGRTSAQAAGSGAGDAMSLSDFLGDAPVERRQSAAQALTATGVGIHFGGIVALRDVSMNLVPGKIHALIGPNGAGKSTLINVLTGFYKPTQGTVALLGQPIDGSTSFQIARKGVARTFQNTELFKEASVRENVLVGCAQLYKYSLLEALLWLKGCRTQEKIAEKEVDRILHKLDLARYASAEAGSLPFGLQRRLEIARALVAAPSILLLDEPAAGLTGPELEELGALIKEIADAGVAILLIEHHIEFVMALASEITVLDYGQVIARGTPDEIRKHPKVIEAYLG